MKGTHGHLAQGQNPGIYQFLDLYLSTIIKSQKIPKDLNPHPKPVSVIFPLSSWKSKCLVIYLYKFLLYLSFFCTLLFQNQKQFTIMLSNELSSSYRQILQTFSSEQISLETGISFFFFKDYSFSVTMISHSGCKMCMVSLTLNFRKIQIGSDLESG